MIDVQNGFVKEHSRHVVPVIDRLIEQWEAAGRRCCSPATSTTPVQTSLIQRDACGPTALFPKPPPLRADCKAISGS
ncbi:hypothetical protein [Streptomyces hundungensis]|uniref:hypothetical protein n=1 Tax=Streptomyces hundungensis TaxID=1077946 RepID=UPI0031E8DE88